MRLVQNVDLSVSRSDIERMLCLFLKGGGRRKPSNTLTATATKAMLMNQETRSHVSLIFMYLNDYKFTKMLRSFKN